MLMKFHKANDAILGDELPCFVVLTGLNGSGKTRGLKQFQNAVPNGTQYVERTSEKFGISLTAPREQQFPQNKLMG